MLIMAGRRFPCLKITFAFGMSLRDYFAAKAMGAILVNATAPSEEAAKEVAVLAARAAYMVADAMLAKGGSDGKYKIMNVKKCILKK